MLMLVLMKVRLLTSLACNDMTGAIVGEWQCGVTSSNVSLQDSLVSSPARIVVQGKGHNHHKSFHVNSVLFFSPTLPGPVDAGGG